MKNNFFFYMFYNNMYETSSKLNEILVLNRQLRNYLSMKGGAKKDLFDFKEQLNKHRYYIFYLFSTCFVTIIYLSFSMMPKNKKFIGGDSSIGDNIKDKMNDFYLSISETFSELFGKLSEFISEEYDNLKSLKNLRSFAKGFFETKNPKDKYSFIHILFFVHGIILSIKCLKFSSLL